MMMYIPKIIKNSAQIKFEKLQNSIGVAEGGQVGARATGRRPWSRVNTLLVVV